MRKFILIIFFINFIGHGQTYQMPSAELAFPMAKGKGKFTKIASDAPIIKVSNGTEFRNALRDFTTDRHIYITTGSIITVPQDIFDAKGNLFIHGEVTPGTGATLTGRGIQFTSGNIIIRNTRFRGNNGSLQTQYRFTNINGITFENVILDRVSHNWPTTTPSNEMMIGFSQPSSGAGSFENITVQRSIIAEGTRGMLINNGVKNATFYQNFYNDFGFRAPISGYPFRGDTNKIDFESINQIAYNGNQNIIAGVGSKVQVVSTKIELVSGGTTVTNEMLRFEAFGGCDGNCASSTEGYIYLNDNSIPSGFSLVAGSDAATRVESTPYAPISVDAVDILPVSQIDNMLPYVGSTPRDQYDTTYVNEYLNNNGTQGTTTGTLNTGLYTAGTMFTDSDNDGMDDAWETNYGLNPSLDDSQGIVDSWVLAGKNWVNHPTNPWTNIEIFWADRIDDWQVLNAETVNGSTPPTTTPQTERKKASTFTGIN